MNEAKTKRGRRPVADTVASVSLSVDATHLDQADVLAEDMGRVFRGLKQTRGDVLRTAISRGIASMRAEIDERLSSR